MLQLQLYIQENITYPGCDIKPEVWQHDRHLHRQREWSELRSMYRCRKYSEQRERERERERESERWSTPALSTITNNTVWRFRHSCISNETLHIPTKWTQVEDSPKYGHTMAKIINHISGTTLELSVVNYNVLKSV